MATWQVVEGPACKMARPNFVKLLARLHFGTVGAFDLEVSEFDLGIV
jgi:hypothetical protein